MTNNDKTTSNSSIEDTEPHPEPIDPNHLLLEIEQIMRRFIVCDKVPVLRCANTGYARYKIPKKNLKT